MRRAPSSTITSQLYRHFAIVTVLLTATVAMFANGENEQAEAAQASDSHIVQRHHSQDDNPTFIDATDNDSGGWGTDDNDADASDVSAPIAAPDDPSDVSGGNGDAGAPPAAAGTVTSSPGPTPAQIAAAEAASRLRSGAGEEDEGGI